MNKVKVKNLNNGVEVNADVLERSDKHLKVVFEKTTTTIRLIRSDVRAKYVGQLAGLQFESTGNNI